MSYFPNCKRKQALAKFILCMAKAIKIATSRTKYDRKDKLHCAFGAYEDITEDQKAVLEELRMYPQSGYFLVLPKSQFHHMLTTNEP